MCWLLHMISNSYVEVSRKYLLHRIAGMSIKITEIYSYVVLFIKYLCPSKVMRIKS